MTDLIFSNIIIDETRCIEFTKLYSSIDYYKNPQFQRLMRNWNIYLESDEPKEEILVEWEEVLLKDFLTEATIWRTQNCISWGKGLE